MCVAKSWIQKDHTYAHTLTHEHGLFCPFLHVFSFTVSHSAPLSAKPLTHTSLSEPAQSGIVNDLMKVGGLFAKESSLQLLALSSEKIQELTCYRNECLYIAAV